ncbi:MAG: hypothetical protein MUW56_09280 [Chryseobacterium sp.]|uniref:hypothetical protein n=1 Tax=Chryseobacterium sp. TaxID=1871047 RepID=UPI0025BD31A7|nr:hypothetical protein [Chryseobacterium sp.]MCJ7933810.1 hypothetical protein [Chryseobacterium sp.]
MKKYIVILFLFFGFYGYSQQSTAQNENAATTKSTEFPCGDDAFTQEFLKMIHAYIDLKKDAVNGKYSAQ